jgi:hypothetical protein
MDLIEIVKRLPWPDGAVVVVQDCTVDGTGLLKYCRTDWVVQIQYIDEAVSRCWATSHAPVHLASSELADDHYEATITHTDWLEAQEQVEPRSEAMNAETQIPTPEMVQIPRQDLEALLAELEHYRKQQQDGRTDA